MPETDEFADAIVDILAVDAIRDAASLARLAGGAAVACNVHFSARTNPEPEGYQAQTWTQRNEIEADYSVVNDLYPGDIFTISSGINAGAWTVAEVIENDKYTIKVAVR